MKKLFAIVAIAAFMTACNDSGSSDTDTTKDSVMMSTEPTTEMTPMVATDGSMTMKDGKMMVMKDGQWVGMDQEMTCTDGCKVKPDGEVVMKDGEKMMMKEGEMIDKDGHMMDANGKMMDMKMDDHMMKDSMK